MQLLPRMVLQAFCLLPQLQKDIGALHDLLISMQELTVDCICSHFARSHNYVDSIVTVENTI